MNREINNEFLFEEKLLTKLLLTIKEHFPEEEEKSIPHFAEEIQKYHKSINDENIIFFLFVRWFLLKYRIGDYVSLIDFLSSNPDMKFNPRELEAIKNIQENYESIFRIIEISKNRKILRISDMLKNKEFTIKIRKPLKKDIRCNILLATIVKMLNGEPYFFGPFLGYTEKEAKIIEKEFFGKK